MKTFTRIIEWVGFKKRATSWFAGWALLNSWCFSRFVSLLGRDISLPFLAGVFKQVLAQGPFIVFPLKMGYLQLDDLVSSLKEMKKQNKFNPQSLEPSFELPEPAWMVCTTLVMCWRASTRDEFSHYAPFSPGQICCAVDKGAINANYEEFCDVGISVVLAWGRPGSFQEGQ